MIVLGGIWMNFEPVLGKKRRHNFCYGEGFKNFNSSFKPAHEVLKTNISTTFIIDPNN